MNKLLEAGIIKTVPKKWSKEEINQLLNYQSEGKTAEEISNLLNRSFISVSIKIKRLTKTGDTYNRKNREIKYSANKKFIEIIRPISVLDLYAGNSWYKNEVAILCTNDIDTKFQTIYNRKALELLCWMVEQHKKFDLVDLDPYGSAIEEFSLALRVATKGIILTLGEIGHKRWKRLDFVRKWYDIERLEDFTVENLIKKIIRIGNRYGKKLVPEIIIGYGQISRVYFRIEKYKTTEQWEK